MKVIHCDICGKEVKSHDPRVNFWKEDIFYDLDDNPIEDVCVECFKWIYCCINMMKKTGWRPDFHEKLNSKSIWESNIATYALEKLEGKTGLKLF